MPPRPSTGYGSSNSQDVIAGQATGRGVWLHPLYRSRMPDGPPLQNTEKPRKTPKNPISASWCPLRGSRRTGSWSGVRSMRLSPARPVLADDGNDDEAKGDETCTIDQRLRFLRQLGEAQDEARQGVDRERRREEQEEAVPGLAPEAKEEQGCDAGGHADRTLQHCADLIHHSASQMRP